MTSSAGMWIDHRRAIIVLLSGEKEDIVEMDSGVDPHVRYSGGDEGEGEFKRERRFENELHVYYDKVIERIRGAASILIFGPGEAKGELRSRLEWAKLGDRITAVETVDKMTRLQIVEKTRQRFPAESGVIPPG